MQQKFSIEKRQVVLTILDKLKHRSLLILALFLLPILAHGQTINPLENDPRAARAGGTLFRAQCATCHGADARGIQNIDAPDLTSLWSIGNHSDESVFQIIRNGVPGSIMPSHSFPDTEVWMLVAYLKSTGNNSNSTPMTGNVGRGEQLFTSNCASCHRAGAEGGSLGPDLSVITAIRSRDALINSVRSPDTILVRGYRPVTLVTDDGRRIQGTIKSEDAFSIQVMDSDQNLRGFMKADLGQVIRETSSLMPQFGTSVLSDVDLDDILGFLDNRRRSTGN